MTHRPVNIDDFIEDRRPLCASSRDNFVNEERDITLASSQAALEIFKSACVDPKSNSPDGRRSKHPVSDINDKPEVPSISDNNSDSSSDNDSSSNEYQLPTEANRILSTDRISGLEKDTNICAKLKRSLLIDASTSDNVDKILTSLSRESDITELDSSYRKSVNSINETKVVPEVATYSQSIRDSAQRAKNSVKNENSRLKEETKLVPEDSTDFQTIEESPQRTTESLNETGNAEGANESTIVDSLSIMLTKHKGRSINDINIKILSTKVRPLERIHFSTPEVEKKWRNIVDTTSNKKQQQRFAESKNVGTSKSVMTNDSERNIAALSLGRKRRYSEVSVEDQQDINLPEEEDASDSESKTEAQINEILGPMPASNSKIFEGMSFVLEYVSLNFINPGQLRTMNTNSEAEYLKEWTRRPFVKDRLIAQINAAGGKFYERSELVPIEEYTNTKLIMNIPHITEENLFCLSVGIEAYSHQWIIRCCQENKIVNPAEERLPAGWSITKESYVEMYQRPSQKPFLSELPFVVVIPMHPPKSKFVSFWKQIIVNSGGVVLVVEEPDDEFMEGTVVLTHYSIPLWVIEKAKRYDIPLVTTRWAVHCLIEGQICDYDAHPSFEYNVS